MARLHCAGWCVPAYLPNQTSAEPLPLMESDCWVRRRRNSAPIAGRASKTIRSQVWKREEGRGTCFAELALFVSFGHPLVKQLTKLWRRQ